MRKYLRGLNENSCREKARSEGRVKRSGISEGVYVLFRKQSSSVLTSEQYLRKRIILNETQTCVEKWILRTEILMLFMYSPILLENRKESVFSDSPATERYNKLVNNSYMQT